MNRVFLSLGGNLNNRSMSLAEARRRIESGIGIIRKASSVYESEPWGFTSSQPFLNQVLIVETELDPHELLKEILNIEKGMGRTRKTNGYSSREIDIDILFYSEHVVCDDTLQIPHPRIQDRMFTLKPLVELDKSFVHPVFKKSVSQLFQECRDSLWVEIYRPEIS
jgi:2-amino-4-hydroxy-6-hydroxymethyldihydropteridine diphosphokinase